MDIMRWLITETDAECLARMGDQYELDTFHTVKVTGQFHVFTILSKYGVTYRVTRRWGQSLENVQSEPINYAPANLWARPDNVLEFIDLPGDLTLIPRDEKIVGPDNISVKRWATREGWAGANSLGLLVNQWYYQQASDQLEQSYLCFSSVDFVKYFDLEASILAGTICRCGHPAADHAAWNGATHPGKTATGACGCVLSREQAVHHDDFHFRGR